MSKTYVLALDQGTTSCRAILFDRDSNIVTVVQKEFTQIYPKPGWVGHDAEEIWSTRIGVIVEAVATGKGGKRRFTVRNDGYLADLAVDGR